MKILLTGGEGMLAKDFLSVLDQFPEFECYVPPREELDITNQDQVESIIKNYRPYILLNCAAYTKVDKAETELSLAFHVNGISVGKLAKACHRSGVKIVHLSTDFVFDGTQGHPYAPDAEPNPLGVYGRSKLDGENAVIAAGGSSVILRTGWVYSRHGGNFVKTMLRLMAEREQLSVVEDQIGTPTRARGLALACWGLADHGDASGIYHWSDAGACSWYDFAVAIREIALELGLLRQAATLLPIPASQYPTPARRPAYSVLDKTLTRKLLGHSGNHWTSQLRAMLVDLQQHEQQNEKQQP